ncbi:2,3-butanediol dehydrogenase [Aneurinibacillus thermoaerophilus]|uniref:2,3-butanediol dehydrogenase n=1 Tax=Aneurinibacillus thermoaerophilus TaxID=143495 RepID=A0ABX8Y917_ANETH|nr:2,3-butanediol dehydrogenase [Aneurinibacillus thermoaerophilus]QYY42158.1 2,3-butanediol dehydrogenase [Aneurinibacillus thermoaerophilus]
MKAARWYGVKDVRVEEIPEQQVKPGMVKIRVEWCGICGTDLHEYLAGPIFLPSKEPHPLTNEKVPLVLGHEFAGEIVEIGESVTKFKVGDRVAVEPILNCGECGACRSGIYNLCEKLGFHGLAGGGGGFSEYTVVKENMVHKLPDQMSYEQGAMVEPAAVAVHAIRQSKLQVGDKVAVFGAGPIGLLTIQAAKAAGASQIIAVELSEERREFAQKVGADIVLDPKSVDVVKEIQTLTNGGVDVSFEVAGVERVLNQAIESAKFDGQIIIVSVWEKAATILPNSLVLKEREMKGILGYRDIFPEVIQLIANGSIKAEELITKKINIDHIIEEGFETLVKEKSHVKILVSPRAFYLT